jgi:NDP-sugar pyrophosphorylase family protein
MCESGARFAPDRIIGGGNDTCVYIAENACVQGGTFDISNGSVFIGPGSSVSGSWICGPVICGENTEVRPGAFVRGNVILGRRILVRGEIKNAVIMDESEFGHPSYLGDSICGYKTHFGNQATAANLNILGRKETVHATIDGQKIDLGRRKVGIIMGDFCQLGCNAVSDPGTFLLPRTIVYSLTRINCGVYGPDELIKNKPMEHGVIERVPLHT